VAAVSKKRHAKRKEKARALAKSLGKQAQAHAAAKHAARMAKLTEKKAEAARKEKERCEQIAKQQALAPQLLEQLRAIEGVQARTKFLDDYYNWDDPEVVDHLLDKPDPEDVLEFLVDEILRAEPEGSSLSDTLSNRDLHWHQYLDAVRASPHAHYTNLMLPLVEACGYPLTAEECEKERGGFEEIFPKQTK